MRVTRIRSTAIQTLAVVALSAFTASNVAAQEATPAAKFGCPFVTPATPMTGMTMGTPMAEGMMAMDLDQMYIDMMIPHHESIIAMAQAALPRLTDDRLREIARDIIATQQPEIEELGRYHEASYGGATPMPMDQAMMTAMDQMMPGMSGSLADMAFQMDANAQVAAICAAEDPDLTFIDLTIPHHRMAIEASHVALQKATHQEIRDFARRVIDAQQREITELTAIRAELTGIGTPTG